MTDVPKATAAAVETEVAALPKDLRLALICWWRARYHGGREDEREAEEMLRDAIGPRIAALRAVEFGEQS